MVQALSRQPVFTGQVKANRALCTVVLTEDVNRTPLLARVDVVALSWVLSLSDICCRCFSMQSPENRHGFTQIVYNVLVVLSSDLQESKLAFRWNVQEIFPQKQDSFQYHVVITALG